MDKCYDSGRDMLLNTVLIFYYALHLKLPKHISYLILIRDIIGSEENMNEFTLYKYMEFLIFSLYLIFIFLLIQIWFLWKNVEKNDLIIKSLVSESFFKKNFIYVFLFSVFFMAHEFIEGLSIPDTMIYFEFFEMLTIITLVLFAYNWHITLKSCKKPPTKALTNE